MREPLSLLHCRDGLLGSAFRPSGHGVERAERDFGADPVTLLNRRGRQRLRQRPEQGFDLRRPPGKPQQRQDDRLPPRVGTELRDQAALLAERQARDMRRGEVFLYGPVEEPDRRGAGPYQQAEPLLGGRQYALGRCAAVSAGNPSPESSAEPSTCLDIPGGKAVFDITAGMIELQAIGQVGQYLPGLGGGATACSPRRRRGAARPADRR